MYRSSHTAYPHFTDFDFIHRCLLLLNQQIPPWNALAIDPGGRAHQVSDSDAESTIDVRRPRKKPGSGLQRLIRLYLVRSYVARYVLRR